MNLCTSDAIYRFANELNLVSMDLSALLTVANTQSENALRVMMIHLAAAYLDCRPYGLPGPIDDLVFEACDNLFGPLNCTCADGFVQEGQDEFDDIPF